MGTQRLRIPLFRELFDEVESPTSRETYNIEGRITSIRKVGKKLYFIDVIQDGARLQIMVSNKSVDMDEDEFDKEHSWFKEGDHISCNGYASRTKAGELTLKVNSPIQILSPALNAIPNKLTDKGIINQNRVMNYLVNPVSKRPIIVKSTVIQTLRRFFLNKGFLEVQTPILSSSGTGANARPFQTTFKDELVQLRVAPELWLKKLVIGGFDKIFEIGTNFRNEGIDQSHNPEFTSCEFYQTHTSLEELMDMTEELFQELFDVFHVSNGENTNGATSFPKYDFLPTLEQITGRKLDDVSLDGLINYHRELGLEIPSSCAPNPTKLLNNLCETYLESLSITRHPNTPVMIYNHPEILSPLAKSKLSNGSSSIPVSLRFELFIDGKEYVNAYEEENDPERQLQKFKQQQLNGETYGDDEMLIPDWEYVKTMQLGLPPTGGWGCGIDRLAMFFSDSERIDQVLPFGNLRDTLKQ
ncbi:uncharacterized protein LODBEIA_P59120 [Lodderomyces beijingensis]|uniref:Lysyl-tRNA synthetase n=1 Tax=Lodderomyces beijingensis TaxID=1775926 RepID=A0ABP0ZVA7_9ASCO